MGSIWLNGRTPGYGNVLDVLRNAGVPVVGEPGWESRSRSSGGFTQLMGIFVHHTASNTNASNDIHYMLNGPGNPISNGLLDRDGVFHIIAAGASNHAGRGGGSDKRPPWITSKGRVPQDAGNSNAWGIECANAGTGQPYPPKQQDSYTLMCAALCDAYGLVASSDIIAHWEWTDRKCDPTGPSRFCTDNNRRGCNNACRWDMDFFRAEVDHKMGTTAPTPPPQPKPPPQGDSTMPAPFFPVLIQGTGKDGSLAGACYVTDQIGVTYRWIQKEATLNDIKWHLREAGLPDDLTWADNLDAFGTLVGPKPG